MTSRQSKHPIHPAAEMHAHELRDGKITRREFLARSTALGLSVGAAYSLLGEVSPARAGGNTAIGWHIADTNGRQRTERAASL